VQSWSPSRQAPHALFECCSVEILLVVIAGDLGHGAPLAEPYSTSTAALPLTRTRHPLPACDSRLTLRWSAAFADAS